MQDTKIMVTISGVDKVGIVAAFANVLKDYDVNIEDIKQTIMQDYFVMFLMADIAKSSFPFHEIKQAILNVGENMGMEVWVQKKTIFDKMHNI